MKVTAVRTGAAGGGGGAETMIGAPPTAHDERTNIRYSNACSLGDRPPVSRHAPGKFVEAKLPVARLTSTCMSLTIVRPHPAPAPPSAVSVGTIPVPFVSNE